MLSIIADAKFQLSQRSLRAVILFTFLVLWSLAAKSHAFTFVLPSTRATKV